MEKFISLKDYVYEYIANQIESGTLKPEEKINENKICEALNISRTPVREALIQLSTEGFLENIPRKGFIIRRLEEREAIEIYMVLGILDGYAARLACNRLSEKNLKNMEFFVKSMDLAIESGNYEMYYKQQEEFHDAYTSQCGNESLVNLIHLVKKKFLRRHYIMSRGESVETTLFETNREHKKMIELFKDKDEAGIETYMRDVHWETTKAYMETV